MRRIVPNVVSLVLAMLASPALATDVIKCRAADGAIAYRDGGCARGERVLARWTAAPDPEAPASVAAKTGARSRGQRRTRGVRAERFRSMASVDPCSAAKERRDAIERRVGLARTYELLSALQRDVYDACR